MWRSGGMCTWRGRRRWRMMVGRTWWWPGMGERKGREGDALFQKFMTACSSGPLLPRVSAGAAGDLINPPGDHPSFLPCIVPRLPIPYPLSAAEHNGHPGRGSRSPRVSVPRPAHSRVRQSTTDAPPRTVQRRIPDYIALHESVSVRAPSPPLPASPL